MQLSARKTHPTVDGPPSARIGKGVEGMHKSAQRARAPFFTFVKLSTFR